MLRPPSNSVFEGPLLGGGLWRLPRMEMIEFVPDRLRRAVSEGWNGEAFFLAPAQPWSRWCPKLHSFETALHFLREAPLFALRQNGRPGVFLNRDVFTWMVTKTRKCA